VGWVGRLVESKKKVNKLLPMENVFNRSPQGAKAVPDCAMARWNSCKQNVSRLIKELSRER
jgi:hypothetical protein